LSAKGYEERIAYYDAKSKIYLTVFQSLMRM